MFGNPESWIRAVDSFLFYFLEMLRFSKEVSDLDVPDDIAQQHHMDLKKRGSGDRRLAV
jgi:hypothetical protein